MKLEMDEAKRFWMILGTIIFLGFSSKLYRIEFPSTMYFDEVYHAFTAKLYVDGNPNAYSLTYKHSEQVAVEWSHPPLAKLIMAASMLVYGENSFGWRASSALFGSLATLVAALLAWQLFNSAMTSYLTAFLMSIEGLIFNQSRLAMNDIYMLLFFLTSLYFYVRWKKESQKISYLLFSGVAFGLAISCKWSAVFTLFILGMDQIASTYKSRRFAWRDFLWLSLFFGVLPLGVYVASYGHFFWTGKSWADLVTLHENMWWYHTHLKDPHDYGSKPYQWILNLRPVYMYTQPGTSGVKTVSNIYNLGNSIILYSGLAVVLMHILSTFKNFPWRRHWNWKTLSIFLILALLAHHSLMLATALAFTLLALHLSDRLSWPIWFCLMGYFLVWVPWIFSPRIMFFYHYLPALPALCILLARQLEQFQLTGRRKTSHLILTFASLWFILFYPNNTGVFVPESFAKKVYFIVPSWR